MRPRIGIAADRNFAYLTGGVGLHRRELYRELQRRHAPPGIGIAAASKLLTGWTAGAGWEYAFTDHWIFRFEYLLAGFPKMSAVGAITEPGGGNNRCTAPADLVVQVARAGMNYKF